MTSGKAARRRRQAAAAPPPVRRKGERRRAQPKVLLGAALALVLIGAGVGAALAFTGGGTASSPPPSKLPDAASVRRLFQGIPQQGNVLGRPGAPVTMVEYIDLQCPYCREFETQVMPDVIARYVRTGKLKVVARPIAFIGPDSVRGQRATIAAGKQGKFFDFAQLLYDNQGTENAGWLSSSVVKDAAASISGLDAAQLDRSLNASAVKAKAQTFASQASTDGVTGTPTLLVGKTGAKPARVTLSTPSDEHTLVAAIQAALH